MITRQELEGNWKQLKGRIRERWGQMTEDELNQVHGDAERLIGVIQQKTGQSRREIEEFFSDVIDQGESAVQQVAAKAREYAKSASRTVEDGYRQVEEQLEAGYGEAQQLVRTRPLESVLAAFGAGIISGVVISLLLRSNRQ